MPWIWGRHAVEEALGSGRRRVVELLLERGLRGRDAETFVGLARRAGVRMRWVRREELDRVAGAGRHQGAAALAEERRVEGLWPWLESLGEGGRRDLVLVALDQIQDPHNLGAIARSAACLGAAALLVPRHGRAGISPGAVRASAGAIERVPLHDAGNLAEALRRVKGLGFRVYGADMGGRPAWEMAFQRPLVLVVGSEGRGLRPLVRERCDELVAIPQAPGGVASLNASCAASILLYEALRNPSP